MKIIHLIHKPQNRGAETFACQLANHQKKYGHEVLIIAVYNGNAQLDWEGSIISLNGKESSVLNWKAWKRLSYLITEFQPDIIQANSGDTLKFSALSKTFFRWKEPIVVRNASEVGRYLSSEIQKKINNFLYKRVTKAISVSKASEKDLLNHFPFLKGKTVTIPVGLENKEINEIQLHPKANRHIVHVGGFSFEKNHVGLIRIIRRVLEKQSNVHVHLVGDGPLRKRIEDFVEKEKIEEAVTFYGFVNNPLDFISAADILILPSIIEGLPGVLLEAMYCKTPVIAYDVGGISEIVNEETGALVRSGSEEDFAEAILEVLKGNESRRVQNAYEMVCQDFMNDKLAENFLSVYNTIIEGREHERHPDF